MYNNIVTSNELFKGNARNINSKISSMCKKISMYHSENINEDILRKYIIDFVILCEEYVDTNWYQNDISIGFDFNLHCDNLNLLESICYVLSLDVLSMQLESRLKDIYFNLLSKSYPGFDFDTIIFKINMYYLLVRNGIITSGNLKIKSNAYYKEFEILPKNLEMFLNEQ
ncbi:TPA: hypothetical protein ACX6SP_003668, partial [Photobacterium damselae]